MEFLAKPKGISLNEHTENVLNETLSIIQAHPFVFSKYTNKFEKDLEKRIKAAAKYHDDGKKNYTWQIACLKEFELFKKTQKVNGSYLQKTGIRHEMESLSLHQNHNFSDTIKTAIAAHHGKLGEKFAERWEKDNNGKYLHIWEYFKELSLTLIFADINEADIYNLAVLQNYEFSGVRSFLQLADHRASIKEDGYRIPEFVKFVYSFNSGWSKRPVQQIAEDNWQDDLLLLRAPTGAGKTDACLLWAKKQIDNFRADRLVIAMPTRFTSNALAINTSESLSETGLYHSSAWFIRHFEKSRESREAEHFAKLQHEFARLLETPVTICTIDHLLIALTHSREDHHSITFNLANSCLVIDEADFYDEFTQANILELLKVLKLLQVPILLMSASLPQSALSLYQKTGFNVNEIKEDISDNQRIRCEVRVIKEYEKVSEINEIIENTKKQPSIIYANTIAKAMEFYNSYSANEKKDITLYHSRFTEPDKMKKESDLLEKLGKKAWESGNASGIAIMTQIGEMSVNISSNYMLSEICPIDRLIQRLGRLSRFDKTIGIVDILIPIKNGKIYPAPYGNYKLNKGWEINKALEDTIKNLTCKQFNSLELVELVNKVYPEISDFTNRTQTNANRLKDQIIQNWLILPFAQTDEEEENTHIWKSRDIEPQSEVFVFNPINYLDDNFQKSAKLERNKDKFCYFDNFKEFMYFKNQYSVSCPMYLLRKGLKSGQVHKSDNIWIGDNREPKHIWITNNYTSELGLILDDKDETKIIDKC